MPETPDIDEFHAIYLPSHPKIEGHAQNRASRLDIHGHDREDFVAEVTAIALQNYYRLLSQGREITEDIRGGTAKFAAKQVASGGRLVGQHPLNDVMSPEFRHGHSLGEPREHELSDGADPAEQAIFNVDLELFLAALDDTLRRVMMLLLEGKTNEQVGREFGFGRGWGSLRRQELWVLWMARFGEEPLG